MKFDFEKFHQELLDTGMHPTRAKEMVKQFRQDIHDWPEIYADWEQCEQLLKMGFIPGHKMLFGEDFNENTYQCYYPDFEYFMAHPVNNHFNIWINDKLTLKYMLNTPELSKYMPEYYLYIENDGHYSYLMDAPEDIPKDRHFVFNLLAKYKRLAAKPSRGSGGRGFLDLRYTDGRITANDAVIEQSDFEDFIRRECNGYLFTQFIEQSSEMEEVFEGTDCALRIVLYKKAMKNYYDPASYGCLIAYARFGTAKSNHASNLCHGGLAVRVNWETGRYEGGFRGNTEFWGQRGAAGFERHPDTGEAIDGKQIPHWDSVREGLLKICRYMSSLDFFGMDVIITQDDFMLCEINSAPSTGLGQFHQGKCCLDTEDAREFAARKRRPWKKSLVECFKDCVIEY